MQRITDKDLETFKGRSATELRSGHDPSRLAWDSVVPALCEEVATLRRMLERVDRFLGETIQCGVEGEMLDGRHVNVAASDLADDIDGLLGLPQKRDAPGGGS